MFFFRSSCGWRVKLDDYLHLIAVSAQKFIYLVVVAQLMTSQIPPVGVRSAAIFARVVFLTFMMQIHMEVKQSFFTEFILANKAADC